MSLKTNGPGLFDREPALADLESDVNNHNLIEAASVICRYHNVRLSWEAMIIFANL